MADGPFVYVHRACRVNPSNQLCAASLRGSYTTNQLHLTLLQVSLQLAYAIICSYIPLYSCYWQLRTVTRAQLRLNCKLCLASQSTAMRLSRRTSFFILQQGKRAIALSTAWAFWALGSPPISRALSIRMSTTLKYPSRLRRKRAATTTSG